MRHTYLFNTCFMGFEIRVKTMWSSCSQIEISEFFDQELDKNFISLWNILKHCEKYLSNMKVHIVLRTLELDQLPLSPILEN